MQTLLQYLAALANDPPAQEAFKKDPDAAINAAQLSDQDKRDRKRRYKQQQADEQRDFVLQFLGDGTISIPTGDGGAVTLNAPHDDDDDGRPRSTDGLAARA